MDVSEIRDGRRATPHPVVGLDIPAIAVSAARHNLALLEDGTVVAWGWNFGGYLGDGTTVTRSAPVRVINLPPGIRAVSAGGGSNLALGADGAVYAWGAPGIRGDGSRLASSTPVGIRSLPAAAVSIAASADSLVLLRDGSVMAWGDHTGGLGDGTEKPRLKPVVVTGLDSGVVAIANGGGCLALRADGSVVIWPFRQPGQATSLVPIPVPGLTTGITAIARGHGVSLALREDGAVLAWGYDPHGQLGEAGGQASFTHVPAMIRSLPGRAIAIAVGGQHCLALLANGDVYGWGSDDSGQLGGAARTEVIDFGRPRRQTRTPVHIKNVGGPAVAIAAGEGHSVALRDDGVLMTWGSNTFSELGDGRPVSEHPRLSLSFRAPQPRLDDEELISRLNENGLSRYARSIVRLAEPSIRLRARPAVRHDRAVGATRLGGHPDLPTGTRWPRFRDEPLAFVAQIDLGLVHPLDRGGLLPSSGLLSFFVDMVHNVSGMDPADRGGWLVSYAPKGEPLTHRAFPTAVPERFEVVGLMPELEVTYPAPESDRVAALGLSWEQVQAYRDLLIDDDPYVHRMLGNPEQIQEDLPFACHLASNSIPSWDVADSRIKELSESPRDWVLLLQVDGEDAAGMAWGDCARLYYWILEQDLRGRRFDRTWLIVQSH